MTLEDDMDPDQERLRWMRKHNLRSYPSVHLHNVIIAYKSGTSVFASAPDVETACRNLADKLKIKPWKTNS